MYQDNTVVTDQVTIIKNMPNDEGKLYIQVYNSKGNYIAIDKDEFLRQVTSLEGTIDYMQKRAKEEEERQNKNSMQANERWQKMSNAFDKYKSAGRDLVNETLVALSSFKQIAQSHFDRMTKKQKEQFYKAERLFQDLNDINGKYKNFHEQNYSAGPQQVTNNQER